MRCKVPDELSEEVCDHAGLMARKVKLSGLDDVCAKVGEHAEGGAARQLDADEVLLVRVDLEGPHRSAIRPRRVVRFGGFTQQTGVHKGPRQSGQARCRKTEAPSKLNPREGSVQQHLKRDLAL
jgi:hypothetical protein